MKKIQFKYWFPILADEPHERLNYVEGELVDFSLIEINGAKVKVAVVKSEAHGIILVPEEKLIQ